MICIALKSDNKPCWPTTCRTPKLIQLDIDNHSLYFTTRISPYFYRVFYWDIKVVLLCDLSNKIWSAAITEHLHWLNPARPVKCWILDKEGHSPCPKTAWSQIEVRTGEKSPRKKLFGQTVPLEEFAVFPLLATKTIPTIQKQPRRTFQ